jgi:hypothetical protein
LRASLTPLTVIASDDLASFWRPTVTFCKSLGMNGPTNEVEFNLIGRLAMVPRMGNLGLHDCEKQDTRTPEGGRLQDRDCDPTGRDGRTPKARASGWRVSHSHSRERPMPMGGRQRSGRFAAPNAPPPLAGGLPWPGATAPKCEDAVSFVFGGSYRSRCIFSKLMPEKGNERPASA